MKRHGDLWPQVVARDNLLLAARKARQGKRDRAVVQRFEFGRERELLRLQRELTAGDYRPGPFTTHRIDRPKRRLISAAPYRDRVVHHAVMTVLEPILDRRFHPDSHACRQGKGTHAASDRLQRLMRRYRYAVACDVRKFFPSIDHAVLKDQFRRLLKDHRLLALLDTIVDAGNEQEPVQDWFPGDDLFTPQERRRGLPIGNLTSRWFANGYLDPLDHAVTSRWQIGGYVRYCDDFVLLDDDRGRLREAVHQVRDDLAGLRLHEERLAGVLTRAGLTFVGYRTWKTHRQLPRATVRRFRRRLRRMRRALAAGAITPDELDRRVTSWIAHARTTASHRLPGRLLG